MSDNLEVYAVEKILRRRMVQNETHYLIKWEGFSSAKNTWEPAANLTGCKELLDELELRMAHFILNVRELDNGVHQYLFNQKDQMPSQKFCSDEAFEKWPLLVIKFLESNINLHSGDKLAKVDLSESFVVIGDPIGIRYVTNVSGGLHYLFDWPNQKFKFVPSGEATEKWPRMVFNYLERHISFEMPIESNNIGGRRKDDNFFVGMQMVTRKRAKMIRNDEFTDTAIVSVQRNYGFDKILLNRPSDSVNRRRTFGGAITSALPKPILKRHSMFPRQISPPIMSSLIVPSTTSLTMPTSSQPLTSFADANTVPASTLQNSPTNITVHHSNTPSSPIASSTLALALSQPISPQQLTSSGDLNTVASTTPSPTNSPTNIVVHHSDTTVASIETSTTLSRPTSPQPLTSIPDPNTVPSTPPNPLSNFAVYNSDDPPSSIASSTLASTQPNDQQPSASLGNPNTVASTTPSPPFCGFLPSTSTLTRPNSPQPSTSFTDSNQEQSTPPSSIVFRYNFTSSPHPRKAKSNIVFTTKKSK